ncbi:MAG: metallophosphoesterase [Oligoflexia bacterium]|nr:metallophosphoesterase [Oligoflexia bacterium]
MKSSSKVVLFKPLMALSAIAAGLGLAYWAPGEASSRATRTDAQGPYLQATSDTSTSILYRPADDRSYQLQYRTGEASWLEARLQATASTLKIQLNNLKPDTTYTYRLVAGDNRGNSEFQFKTAPAPGSSANIKVAVFGDSGSGDSHQIAVAKRMQDWQPNILLHLGDIVYPNGEEVLYEERFFKPYAALLSSTTIFPTLGNHDLPNIHAYTSIFAVPFQQSGSPSPRFYSFNFGSAHFVALDSNLGLSANSEQLIWLQQDLKQRNLALYPWTIVYMHHPLRSTTREPEMAWRSEALNLFESAGVDLVLAGHDHAYQRFIAPEAGKLPSPIFIVSGGGGKKLYPQQISDPQLAVYQQSFHFVGLVLNRHQLSLEAIDEQGKTFDTYRIEKSAAVN